MNIFKRKTTKWKPLGSYSYDGVDYITFFKKNIKTGMLTFKTKKVNINIIFDTSSYPILPTTLIDTKKAWEEMMNS